MKFHGCLIWLLVGLLVTSAYIYLLFRFSPEDEWKRFSDPSGNYVAVITVRRVQWPHFGLPGQAEDRAGFIRIEDKNGRNLGKVPLELVWMADDLQWTAEGARLTAVADWDFQSGTCTYWQASGREKTIGISK